MAGLLYKFFPTDFFFPPPQPHADDTQPQLIPNNSPNGSKIEDSEAPKSLSLRQADDKHVKAIPVTELLRKIKWLMDHLEFLSNPFYVAGGSYSGITVPTVAHLISDGNEVWNKPFISLKVSNFF